jgi:hypothetical protein
MHELGNKVDGRRNRPFFTTLTDFDNQKPGAHPAFSLA